MGTRLPDPKMKVQEVNGTMFRNGYWAPPGTIGIGHSSRVEPRNLLSNVLVRLSAVTPPYTRKLHEEVSQTLLLFSSLKFALLSLQNTAI